MSLWGNVEPWLKGGVGPVVGYGLGLATPYGRRIWRWVTRKPDLRMYVEQDPSIIFANSPENWIGSATFVPIIKDELPSDNPKTNFAIREWAMGLGGIPAGSHEIEVTLTAWEKLDVVVDAMKVEARAWTVPDGVILTYPVGGASIEKRRLQVELATFGPAAKYVDPRGDSDSQNFSFHLTGGEVAKIHLGVTAAPWADETIAGYEWTAKLFLLVNNKRRTLTLDDNGNPFRFVRAGAHPMYMWLGEWQPA